MKYYLIFAILFSSFLYSQDVEKLKKLDTIYILFKEGKDQKKQIIEGYNMNGYWLSKNIQTQIKFDTVGLPIIEIRRKSFLRKHKREIISADFFILKNRRKIDEINKTPKIYYIIDEADFDKKNITLTAVESPQIHFF